MRSIETKLFVKKIELNECVVCFFLHSVLLKFTFTAEKSPDQDQWDDYSVTFGGIDQLSSAVVL